MSSQQYCRKKLQYGNAPTSLNSPSAQFRPKTQSNPLQDAHYRKMGKPSSYNRPAPELAAGGLKSGMTVEDLKRLTQKRMENQTSGEIYSPVIQPRINPPGIAPGVALGSPHLPSSSPSARGMTVQELKQLTSMRLAGQGTPVGGTNPMIQKVVLSNSSKLHLKATLGAAENSPMHLTPKIREFFPQSMRSPENSPAHSSTRNIPEFFPTSGYTPNSPIHNINRNPPEFYPKSVLEARKSPVTSPEKKKIPEFYPQSVLANAKALNKSKNLSLSLGEENNSKVEEIISPRGLQLRKIAGLYRQGSLNQEEKNNAKNLVIQDSLIESASKDRPNDYLSGTNSFSKSSLWSLPDSKSDFTSSYAGASFFHQAPAVEDSFNTENSATSLRGLQRRPSMTVPWQVAESVLDLDPTTTVSTTIDSKESISSGFTFNTLNDLETDVNPSEAKKDSNERKNSFGNAAQFFKFRRRSKSRLEIARDANLAAAQATTESDMNRMPGIDEKSNHFYATSPSNNTSPFGNRGILFGSNFQDEGNSKFGGFQFSSPFLDIPPMSTENNTSPSSLPLMSPNGAKLQKVAMLARKGSLSAEDKTRVKDEIIQKSLSAGASNMATISKIKLRMTDRLSKARDSIDRRSVENSPEKVAMSKRSPSPSLTPSNTYSRSPSSRTPPGFIPLPSPRNLLSPRHINKQSSLAKMTLEERMAEAAKKVASCVSKNNMSAFSDAMLELDALKLEARDLISK